MDIGKLSSGKEGLAVNIWQSLVPVKAFCLSS